MRVGVIGLGSMGAPVARNLIGAGHALTVYNRTRSRADEFGPLGAHVADTPAEAAADAEALVSMLSDDGAVEETTFEPGGVLESLPAGAVHVSMSTISVALSRRLAEAHASRSQHYVAAPVFGRPDAASAAKLFVVAGGPVEQVERCRPIFDGSVAKNFQLHKILRQSRT
jgi:3-hydroxyisobutyrate dehydrogenase-like beta-hydroxyacid dehydrogenase